MEPDWIVRPFQESDYRVWLEMRATLWPGLPSDEDDELDARRWLARTDAAVLVAESRQALVGFVEVGERAYADGCRSSPVAFLEGWFVVPDARRHGVGTGLVKAAEAWAQARGLLEFASDAPLEDVHSHAAHLATGFAEVERVVRFRKPLSGGDCA